MLWPVHSFESYNVAVNDPIFYWGELLSPLQGPPAPTWQIPICLTLVSLLVLLAPAEELEGDGCALADITDTVNESTLNAIAESKNMNRGPIMCYRELLEINSSYIS